MARATPKKSSAIQASAPAANDPGAAKDAPPAEPPPPRLGWGWKVAAIVWVFGFGALGLYELIATLLKLIRG